MELTEQQQKELLALVDTIEVDVDELPSFVYDSDPYMVGYPLCMGSGSGDWDEDEEYVAQIEEAINRIEADGVMEYVTAPEDADDYGDLTLAAVEFLNKEKYRCEKVK